MSEINWQFQTEQTLVENHGLKLDEFAKIVDEEIDMRKDTFKK